MNPQIETFPESDIPVAAVAILPESTTVQEADWYIRHYKQGVAAYDAMMLPTACPQYLNHAAKNAWFDGYWSASQLDQR
jgi:hypothetical protein